MWRGVVWCWWWRDMMLGSFNQKNLILNLLESRKCEAKKSKLKHLSLDSFFWLHCGEHAEPAAALPEDHFHICGEEEIRRLFIHIRAGWPPKTSFATLNDQLPSMSGVHGFKDFLCSAHLHGSFDGQIYSLKHFHKSKFVPQRTHEDGHYGENPSNHELLTVRAGDCRASKKMFRGLLPP